MPAAISAHPETPGHPLFARVWPVAARQLDQQGGADHRARLLSGLTGRVLDVGAGDGRNFGHYPETVDEVVAVEPEPYLRERAEAAAVDAPVRVTVIDGIAEALPVPEDAFDAAVTSLVLCSVDQQAALAELRRVLRPGGRLRFFEHVVADRAAHRRLQQALDATVWPHLAGGCHTARDTLGALEPAGFTLQSVARFRFPEGRAPTPTSPHVLGEALAT